MRSVNSAKGGYAKHLARRKPIDMRYNYVMDMVERTETEIVQIPSYEMSADFMTKPLGPGDLENALSRFIIFC